MTLIVEPDPQFAATLAFALGEEVMQVDGLAAVPAHLDAHPYELLVLVGPDLDAARALELASIWQVERPHVGMVLLRRRVDVQLMAEALRAGVREVVGPEDLAAVVAAARRSQELSRRRIATAPLSPPAAGTPRPGRIVTVFSAKGGCGKTTVATNLAAALAQGGARVCLVDLDLEFGDVAIALQLVPRRTISDLVPMVGTIDAHGVASVLTAAGAGMDTVLAPVAPGEASRIGPELVSELLRTLRGTHDVVVVDTPPAMTEQVLAAFDVSDLTVLLATLDVPAIKNLKVSLDTLAMLGYPPQSRVVVLNRADAKVGLTLADVEQTIGVGVAVQIPSSGDVPASINRGQLIVRERPDHSVSRSLSLLAQGLGVLAAPAGPIDLRGGEARHASRLRRLRRSGAR